MHLRFHSALTSRFRSRTRSHHAGEAEKIIPINHATAEIIVSKRSCFENSLAVNRGQMIHCFSIEASPVPNFSAMSPLMKYGRVYCRLLAILE
jgi:hypothetical protein